jgi:hypothetical protein
MRKLVVAVLSAIVVGLMLSMPVSAGKSTVGKSTMITIPDRTGDLGKYNVYIIVGGTRAVADVENSWGGNAPLLEATYVDMVSVSFGVVRDSYVFSMKVAGDLPQPGDPLPPGIRYVGFMLWIEDGPWDPTSKVIPKTLYELILEFDGSSYIAYMWDYAARTIEPLPSSCVKMLDARSFQVLFTPEMIGGLDDFWWSAGSYLAKEYEFAWPWITDLFDIGAAPGQVGTDFHWPPA